VIGGITGRKLRPSAAGNDRATDERRHQFEVAHEGFPWNSCPRMSRGVSILCAGSLHRFHRAKRRAAIDDSPHWPQSAAATRFRVALLLVSCASIPCDGRGGVAATGLTHLS